MTATKRRCVVVGLLVGLSIPGCSDSSTSGDATPPDIGQDRSAADLGLLDQGPLDGTTDLGTADQPRELDLASFDQPAPDLDLTPVVDVLPDAPLPPKCGDGVVNGNDQCDTWDFAGKSCSTLGFNRGLLACTGQCTIDSAGCYNVLDPAGIAVSTAKNFEYSPDVAYGGGSRPLLDAPYGGGARKKYVWTGSHNYTGAALRTNDETLLRLEDPALFSAYLGHWNKLWQ